MCLTDSLKWLTDKEKEGTNPIKQMKSQELQRLAQVAFSFILRFSFCALIGFTELRIRVTSLSDPSDLLLILHAHA